MNDWTKEAIEAAARKLDELPVRSYDEFELELDGMGIAPGRAEAQSLLDRCPPEHRVAQALRDYLAQLNSEGDLLDRMSFTPLESDTEAPSVPAGGSRLEP